MNADVAGRAENTNSLLPSAKVMNDPVRHSTSKKERLARKNRKRTSEKTWYGWLQGWVRGKRLVLGCIDLIRTGKLRVNLHVKVYERGRWPYFREEYQAVITDISNVIDPERCDPAAFTIQIPARMIHDIREEIKLQYGTRVEPDARNQWMKKRYKR